MELKTAYAVRGVSLIEVLVALLVLGVGVMGFAALQMRAVDTTSTTYSRTQAMAIARDLVERINTNPSAWPLGYTGAGVWSGPVATSLNNCILRVQGGDADCSVDQMAAADVNDVRQTASAMLFGGSIVVEERCRNQQVACVVVAWDGADPAICDPDLVSIDQDDDNNLNSTCVIVEFWPQQALIAVVGEGQ